jgi:hypothetical protein
VPASVPLVMTSSGSSAVQNEGFGVAAPNSEIEVTAPTAAVHDSPPRTHLQHGIVKPKKYTDGTV